VSPPDGSPAGPTDRTTPEDDLSGGAPGDVADVSCQQRFTSAARAWWLPQ
jgi:hypothetical protein